MIDLPPFQLNDLGWFATLPTEVGSFLGKPIEIEIASYSAREKQPNREVMRFVRKILKQLPKVLEQAERALRQQTQDSPEAWPRNPDLLMSFGDEGSEDGIWMFLIEAIDYEGGSWDIQFTGTQLTDIYPATS